MPLDLVNEERAASSASSTSDPPQTSGNDINAASAGQSSLSPLQSHPPAPIHHAPSFDNSQPVSNGSSCVGGDRMSTDTTNADTFSRMTDLPPQVRFIISTLEINLQIVFMFRVEAHAANFNYLFKKWTSKICNVKRPWLQRL